MGNNVNDRIIFGLRTLIAVNEKRFQHYKSASNHYKNRQFSPLLRELAKQSQTFVDVLKQCVTAHGGTIKERDSSTVFSTLWLLLKDSFKIDSVDILISECVAIEREALKLHKIALTLSFLPLTTKSSIRRQIQCFEDAIVELHALRKNYVNEFQLI